jgi:two-component system, OmpR family, response regulator ArlR
MKILVVEDNLESREFFGELMSAEGYDVALAASGAEAINNLKNDQFDLVMLDIMMEEMDGIEVLKKVRKELKLTDLPVLMITASVDIEKVVKAFKAGANGYIVKPFEVDELTRKIRELTR